MSITERVKQVAETYGGLKFFCEKANLNYGSIRGAINRGGGITSATIETIATTYTEINLRWLLLGEGDMFVKKGKEEEGDLSGQQFKEDAAPYIAKLNDLLEKRVNELERELKKTDSERAKDLGID